MIGILSILIGYLLGSISPAYFLGRLLKRIDIREHGSKNAGGENAYKVLGLWPGVITIIFDMSKGLLAMLIASFFVPHSLFIYLAGLAAIVGHIYPFYLKFRGGQGQGTAVGLLFYSLIIVLINHWFSWLAFLILAIGVLLIFYISKSGLIAGLVILPFFIAFLLLGGPLNLLTIFLAVLLIFIWSQALRVGIKEGRIKTIVNKLSKKQKQELLRWRTLMRPLAILILVLYALLGKSIILMIIGGVALVFILTDISRLSFKKFNILLLKGLFIKEKEKRVFSSMSFFLLAVFIILLIFERNIAFMAIIFLIFGDLAAKYFGILFGQRKFFGKSLEGFLGYFVACLLSGFLATYFLELSFLVILIGAAVAAIVEVVPIGIDDNFTVGLISATAMVLSKGI